MISHRQKSQHIRGDSGRVILTPANQLLVTRHRPIRKFEPTTFQSLAQRTLQPPLYPGPSYVSASDINKYCWKSSAIE
jgi:hypothetical protein